MLFGRTFVYFERRGVDRSNVAPARLRADQMLFIWISENICTFHQWLALILEDQGPGQTGL